MPLRTYARIAERSAWTFVQSAAGVIIASQGFGATVWKAAAISGGLAVAKCLVAVRVGGKNEPSLP